MIDAPMLDAADLVVPPKVSEVEALWTDWIDIKARAKIDRSYLANLRSTMREFLRVNRIGDFQNLKAGQLESFLEARLAKRNYSRKYLKAQVKSIQAFMRRASKKLGFSDPFATFDLRDHQEIGNKQKSIERRMLLMDE